MRFKKPLESNLVSLLYESIRLHQRLPHKRVLEVFTNRFPNAQFVTWKRLQNRIWEARFLSQDQEFESRFLENGQWLLTKTYKSLSSMPKRVRNRVQPKLTQARVKKSYLLSTPTKTCYEVQFYNGGSVSKLKFDLKGEFLEETEFRI